MTYAVKEIFYTLQGEGANVGRPAVFLRFAGCNLWSGLERDREAGPGGCSRWCDTDFVGTDGIGGGKFRSPEELVDAVSKCWPNGDQADTAARQRSTPFVVCTGGEPLLQLDEALLAAFNARGWNVSVETNGTVEPPVGKLWLTVSPKAHSVLKVTRGSELKLVFPQVEAEPERFESLDFEHFFLQPMDGPNAAEHTARALEYCLAHPQWRLSLQTHKILRIP
jgi:7-carboxy-7-deazaguanine synthase